jgi:hypothetical protein
MIAGGFYLQVRGATVREKEQQIPRGNDRKKSKG